MQQAIDIERLIVASRTLTQKQEKRHGLLETLDQFVSRISEKDKAEFCTQLAVMLQARVSLHRALEVLARQTTNRKMRAIIEHVGKEVQKGNSFSKALRSRPNVFEELFVVSAEVGQESGRLSEVLSRLAQHLGKMSDLKRKVVQAMTYPILVICVAFFAVAFLLVFIVPTFAEMFKSFQVELPSSTKIVLQMSNIFVDHGFKLILTLIVGLLLLRRTITSVQFRQRLEAFVFRLPMLGDLVLKNHVARFCRTLGTLLQAQVSLVDALDVSQRISTNGDMKKEIGLILRHVKEGKAVAEPLIDSKLFPPLVAQMITVGEETSELDSMLLKVADYYEKELDAKVEGLSSIIEPVIILLLGMLVAGILISMYMPMFELVNVVGGW